MACGPFFTESFTKLGEGAKQKNPFNKRYISIFATTNKQKKPKNKKKSYSPPPSSGPVPTPIKLQFL